MVNKVPSKANVVQFRPGDEVVILRRRHHITTDVETQEKSTINEDLLVAAVRCPEDLEITGGTIEGEFDEDQKYVTIRLRCRNLSPQ